MPLTAQNLVVPPRHRLLFLPPLVYLFNQSMTHNLRKARAQMPFLSVRRHERIDIRWPCSSTGIQPVDLVPHVLNRPWSEDAIQTFAQFVLSAWAIGLDVDLMLVCLQRRRCGL